MRAPRGVPRAARWTSAPALVETPGAARALADGFAVAACRAIAQDARMTAQNPGSDPELLGRVARAALEHVADGMILGLGTGRAAEAFIHALGNRVRAGLRVSAVPTSNKSAELAKRLQIEVVSLEDVTRLDVAFDGADEVTPSLALTKGLGGALLRERVVAAEADRFIVLVTPEKIVDKLGSRTPIPIEVVPFAGPSVIRRLKKLGGVPVVRTKDDGFPYFTDNGNWIIDTGFGPMDDPRITDAAVRKIPGVVDLGLFLDMADIVLVADPAGVREMRG